MARLVVGNDLFLFGSDEFGLLFEAADDAVHGVQKVLLLDDLLVFARGHQGGLVAHVGNVSSAKPGRLAREKLNVDVFAKLEWAKVNLKNFDALRNLRKIHINDAVKASGTHEGAIQNVGAVRGAHDDYVLVGSESVHLGKELVERVFALVVASAERIAAARTSDGIDFVNKDDARRLFFGLLEEVAHTAGSDTHKHFDEVGTAQ